jgi:ABC-type branched-subunit amino acid transport system permease subunit
MLALRNALRVAGFLVLALVVLVLPTRISDFRASEFALIGIFFIAILGLNVLTGYAGVISLGHGAFMAIGAYVTGILMLGRPGLVAAELAPPGWLPVGDGMKDVYTIPIAAIVAALAVLLLIVRVAQRSTVQFVFNSLVGIAIAAFFALRSGKAEDAFLPGILYNAGYAVAMTFSIVIRWPLVGFIVGSVGGDPTAWHRDRDIVRLCSRLTWLLVLPCVLRVVIQYPLYLAGQVGWLGAAKVVMGWPLQVAALGAMLWLLARGRTPLKS